jgi:hypothetical protein
VEWKERLNADISVSGMKYQSFLRNLKVCVLRFAGTVSTLKLACATFGLLNGVDRAFKRRDISMRNEITESSPKIETLRFAICRDCFDTAIGVRYVRRVEWSEKSVKTPRYLIRE